jgi:hypothetical protein
LADALERVSVVVLGTASEVEMSDMATEPPLVDTCLQLLGTALDPDRCLASSGMVLYLDSMVIDEDTDRGCFEKAVLSMEQK